MNTTTTCINKDTELDFAKLEESMKILQKEFKPYTIEKIEISESMYNYLMENVSVEKAEKDHPYLYGIIIEVNEKLVYGDFKVTYKLRSISNQSQRYEDYKRKYLKEVGK